MATEKYTIELSGSTFEIAAQKVAINAVVNLSADHRPRIVEIMKNEKALKAIKDKWSFLKAMF